MKNGLYSLFRYLPLRICESISLLPNELFESATEIRLRKNAPISVTVGKENITFDSKGRICKIEMAMRATEKELLESIERLTDGSLYTCDEYLKNGFIPLATGGRAGITGKSNGIGGWAEIQSINLRIQRFVPNSALPLIEKFSREGIKSALVCSPPAMGKTTFLKSAAYLLGNGIGISPKRVGIADERGELFCGIPEGGLIDNCAFLPKDKGISLLTRVMAPEIIICDEITANEVEAVNEAINCGVSIVASAHCENIQDLLRRGRMKSIVNPSVFPFCVILSNDLGFNCDIFETEAIL